jgi:hypothetical protein
MNEAAHLATERLDVQPSSSQMVPLAFDAASVKMNKSSSEVVERDYRPWNRERIVIDTTQLAAFPEF